MERVPQDVTDAELAVLQVLWDQGAQTIRRLTDILYPEGTEPHNAPGQKRLDRLEAKAPARRDRSTHAHTFSAVTGRDDLVGYRLRAMAEKLCGGLMAPLLTHLVKAEALTAEERRELRTLIEEQDRKSKRERR